MFKRRNGGVWGIVEVDVEEKNVSGVKKGKECLPISCEGCGSGWPAKTHPTNAKVTLRNS